MVSLASILADDPTLMAADMAMVEKAAQEKPREYLGASSIGDDCSRRLWYRMRPEIPRKPFDAATIKRFQDGFAGEDIIIDRLRKVPGLHLWNRDEDGEQIGGTLFDGKFGWHVDGVVFGLIQAPKTYHVFEAKVVNETKFNKFKKLKTEYDEKQVLAEWDTVYLAQAVVYMELLNLTRHYLVVSTPGVRDWASCRTEANKPMAKALIHKAERIIKATTEPERLSEDKNFWVCKYCEFRDVCHANTTQK